MWCGRGSEIRGYFKETSAGITTVAWLTGLAVLLSVLRVIHLVYVTDLDVSLVESLFMVVALHDRECGYERLVELRNKVASVVLYLYCRCPVSGRSRLTCLNERMWAVVHVHRHATCRWPM